MFAGRKLKLLKNYERSCEFSRINRDGGRRSAGQGTMTETRRIAERTLLPQLGEVRIQGFAGTELIDVERAGLSRC